MMNVFVAGGTGAIGVPLVRQLVAAGHQVTALTRSSANAAMLEGLGATPAVADALDAEALLRVVVAAHPTHVIHQLTALPKGGPKSARDLEATNRLRSDGTRNLIAASVAAGAQRMIGGSFALIAGSTRGVPADVADAAKALQSMESQILDASRSGTIEGVVLRYGMFYGPDVASTIEMIAMARRRRLPAIRGDRSLLPCIDVDDAARATVAALDRAPAGSTYDIVDDEPVSFSEIVRTLASAAGARPPIAIPSWLPSDRALHGAHDRVTPAAIEREGARRARLAAVVSHDSQRPAAGAGARGLNMIEVDLFQSHRPALFGVAYRMLGSATDAEDVVQDATLRYSAAQPADLRSAKACLTTIVTRLCLDRLKSARARREEYVGPWLPEPVVTGDRREPESSLAQAESVTLAFMVLLETLTPEERAVFLLREVFDYQYAEIAQMLETTAVNCRQLFHRVKARIAERKPRFRATVDQKRPLVERFVRAFRDGSEDELTAVLAADVGLWSDGGGKVAAAGRPLFGREHVVNLLVGIRRTAPAVGISLASVTLDIVEVNGEPAVVVCIAGRLDSVYVPTVEGDQITALRIVRNPDKLTYIGRQLGDAVT